ncbi:MAG: family 3 adenylate cyclase [Acidimicrobiales bacterium]|nr:family 3 adenylate cyclase [Acidimicrobiales bacterium]
MAGMGRAEAGDGGVDVDALAAAGLIEPGAPGALERLGLLQHLAARGATIDQMVAAARSDRLTALAADLVMFPDLERITVEAAAELLRMDVDRLRRVRLAIGLPLDGDDPTPLTTGDLETLAAFELGAAVFGDAATLQYSRVIGSAAARLAEAAVQLFNHEAGPRLASENASEVERAKASEDAIEALQVVPDVFRTLLMQHTLLAIRRSSLEQIDDDYESVHAAVGFVDLVGSTAWAQELSPAELGRALVEFETAAFDAACRHGGRVVKLIGDEAMFAAPDPYAACHIGLELCALVEVHPILPSARGGVACGPVTARDGDYFGSVVNLASRTVHVAEPSTMVITDVVAQVLDGRSHPWQVEALPPTEIRGFAELQTLHLLRHR